MKFDDQNGNRWRFKLACYTNILRGCVSAITSWLTMYKCLHSYHCALMNIYTYLHHRTAKSTNKNKNNKEHNKEKTPPPHSTLCVKYCIHIHLCAFGWEFIERIIYRFENNFAFLCLLKLLYTYMSFLLFSSFHVYGGMEDDGVDDPTAWAVGYVWKTIQ